MFDPSIIERNGLKSHIRIVFLSVSFRGAIIFCFIYSDAPLSIAYIFKYLLAK
jgi:hypothetical protein